MILWNEMQKKFKNEWVAMTNWEEDEHGDVVKGDVVFHSPNRKEFYDVIKDRFSKIDLAIRFTGNVTGPFFFDR